MNLSKPFLIFIVAFSIGVFIASFLDFSFYFGFLFVFLGFIVWLLGRLKIAPTFLFLAMVFCAFGVGFSWYDFKASPPDLSFFGDKINRQVQLKGVVIDEPEEKENYTRLIVEVEKDIKILAAVRHYPEFHYGDEVELSGLLKKPDQFNDFDWPAYLSKDNIYFEMFYPQINLVASGKGTWIKERLFSLKGGFLNSISRVTPEPHSSLLGGLTVGAKESMSEGLLEDFRRTGIIHIVVLSGYNVTIVADAIMSIFSFLPSFLAIGAGIIGIVFFALMTGGSATIVRAAIMAALALLARATGRIYEITIALFATGFLMILHNPKILRFDSSFQLSFLATMALIYLAPIVERYLKFFPKKFGFREIASVTIATQIFVLPLLMYKTGIFSLVSLPANLLILLFVPVTMFLGFLTGVFGFISYFLSVPFSWLTYFFLDYDLKVVEFFSSLNFASFSVSSFPLWLMLVLYIFYAMMILKLKQTDKKT